MKAFCTAISFIVFIIYPFLIYFGVAHLEPKVIAAILILFLFLRIVALKSSDGSKLQQAFPILGTIGACYILVILSNSQKILLLQPVFINLVFLFIFGITLYRPPSIIERYARLRKSDLPPIAINYCRKVTVVWCIFFVINGSIAFLLAAAGSLSFWAVYTGFVSYILIGLLMGIEFCYRKIVKVPQFEQFDLQQTNENN